MILCILFVGFRDVFYSREGCYNLGRLYSISYPWKWIGK